MPFQNRTLGSNPSLSATQSGLQRNRATLPRESLKSAAIPQVLPLNCTRGSVPPYPAGTFSDAFLWRAHAQSGFSDSVTRMQCDHKPMMRRKRLDFVSLGWRMWREFERHSTRNF
jgi:hypothetical protein